MRASSTKGIVAAALGAALLLSGCGSPRQEPWAPPLGVPDFGISVDRCGALAPEPWVGDDGFEPVAALVCEEFATVEDAMGTWSAVVMRRLEGDLEAVRDADAAQDDAPWNGPCTADMVIEPARWLVDAEGRGVAVAEPRDGCGKPKGSEVGLAVQRLEEVGREELRLRLEESVDAVAAGCPSWHAPFRIATIDGPQFEGSEPEGMVLGGTGFDGAGLHAIEPGIVVLPQGAPLGAPTAAPGDALPAADGLQLCRYRDGAAPEGDAPANGGSGTIESSAQYFFVGAEPLDAAGELLALLERDRAVPLEPCFATATSAVQLRDAAGTAIAVELDGCRAIGVTGGAASEELLQRIG